MTGNKYDEGMRRLRRFVRDPSNNRLLLLSDSHRQDDYSPIIVTEEDEFQIEAKVVDVVKAVKV